MAQSVNFCEQTERWRRPARDSTDSGLRDSPLKLADENTANAGAGENDETAVWQAGSDDGVAV
jgi:hypothetical protein